MSRNKNTCIVRRMPDDVLKFSCGSVVSGMCDFSSDNLPCIYLALYNLCSNKDAQNDAMSRAAHAIQQEQVKRANAVLTVEEEVERAR